MWYLQLVYTSKPISVRLSRSIRHMCRLYIKEFQFFRIPSATEMPYRATVLKLWHNKSIQCKAML